MARTLIATMLLLAALLPHPAAAAPNPDTAPCYAAAMASLTAQGAPYSQGGYLAGDPINPATGTYSPRTGPDSFDCSGLVWWAYAQAGVNVGTTTTQQVNDGVPINCTLAQLAGAATTCWTLGDLIFLKYPGGAHVAIYVGRGLFMDCYNHETGCILHDVRTDSFYAAHWWQARRIVSGCEGLTTNPGTPTTPTAPTPGGDVPLFSAIPDLIGYVAFQAPQCDTCTTTGAPFIAPEQSTDVDWALGPLAPFAWLSAVTWNMIRSVLCVLLQMLQFALNALATAINAILFVLNTVYRLLVLLWLSIVAMFLALWAALGDMQQLWASLASWGQILMLWGQQLIDLLVLVLGVVAQFMWLLLGILLGLLGVLGWVGAFIFSLMTNVTTALASVAAPAVLGEDHHIVYQMTRGGLEAIIASPHTGWLITLLWALAWLGFVAWAIRFITGGRD